MLVEWSSINPSHINLKVLDSEDVLEVFEELDKILTDLFLGGCCDLASRKASAHGLLDPKHVCQVDPRVVILDGRKSSWTLEKSASFFE